MVFTDLLMAIILAALGAGFFFPFISWPVDPHFGSFSLWTLFRRPNEKIPREVILGNMGLSRIFLHYVVDWVRRIAGRKTLHKKVRWIQAGALILTGEILYAICREYLQVGPVPALIGTVCYYFAASRPQLLFSYINAEPFYNVFSASALWFLLWGTGTSGHSFQAFLLFSMLFVFAGLNAKPCFLIDPILIGLTALICFGWSWSHVVAMGIGGFLGGVLYGFLLKEHIYPDSFTWMMSYRKQFSLSAFKMFSILRNRYRRTLYSGPLLGLLWLGMVGVLSGPWDKVHFILCTWLIASFASLILQGRFELYHFLIILPALSILSIRGISTISAEGSVVVLGVGLVTILLWRRPLKDFCFFYGSASISDKLARGISNYIYYWDTRMDQVIEHDRNRTGHFIAWGIVPQIYYLADRRPISSYTFFHQWMNFLYTPWKEILLHDAVAMPPEWIYDFNAWNDRYGRFNPLAFYASTGLKYNPEKKENNLVYYRLMLPAGRAGQIALSESSQSLYSIYVNNSSVSDLFLNEVTGTGYDLQDLPPTWQQDISKLTSALACGVHQNFPELPKEEENLWQDASSTLVLQLYGAAIFLHRGKFERGRKFLSDWLEACDPFVAGYPLIKVSTILLMRLAGLDKGRLKTDADLLNMLPAGEALYLARFLFCIMGTDHLDKEEQAGVLALLCGIGIDGGAYYDAKADAGLRELKEYCLVLSSGLDGSTNVGIDRPTWEEVYDLTVEKG